MASCPNALLAGIAQEKAGISSIRCPYVLTNDHMVAICRDIAIVSLSYGEVKIVRRGA